MATIVIDLRDRRPIWELPNRAREAITASLPRGWTVRFMETLSDGSGDGAGRASGELLEAVADARVYMGYGIPAEVLDHGRRIEWVHSGAAGVASSLHSAMLASDVLFTNSAGIHAAPMAETVMAMILHFARGLDVAVRAQRDGRWSASEYWAVTAPVTEVGASTVGIVGFGGIGREVARRAAAMGAKVVAVRRGGDDILTCIIDDEKYGLEYQVGSGRYVLDHTLCQSDYLVLALPETAETCGIMTRERLFAMKPGAVLINVARGRLVDEQALLEALDSGPLRGAGLDVFHSEPLPADHPFYRHPRVLMTPHVSATTRRFWDRQTELIKDNIGRFARGEPLRNLVDKTAGY